MANQIRFLVLWTALFHTICANADDCFTGDFDADGDVDLLDFGQFQVCYSGMDHPFTGNCQSADFDGDNDVDLVDFGAFQQVYGQPWSSLEGGLSNPTPGPGFVYALTVHDDGSGPGLFAGGFFRSAGGIPVSHIAKWDGTTWSSLGSGLDYFVQEMISYDDGSGSKLYVGGQFSAAGEIPVQGIARWNGTTWSQLDQGFDVGGPRALAVFDDGTGNALYAGGDFYSIKSGVHPRYIARWDGKSWSALGSGVNGPVYDLKVFDDGDGDDLYVAGNFVTAGGLFFARGVARWN